MYTIALPDHVDSDISMWGAEADCSIYNGAEGIGDSLLTHKHTDTRLCMNTDCSPSSIENAVYNSLSNNCAVLFARLRFVQRMTFV